MWTPLRGLILVVAAFLPAAQVDDMTFDSDGVPIRFTVDGEGETPVVLLHGFAGNLELFRMSGLVGTLAREHLVISVDARGHGKSGKPHGAKQYGVEMVEDVVRLLDHLGFERAHVVGYSMGGMIALKLATTHPERVLSVVAGGAGWVEFEPEGEDMMDEVASSLEAGEGFGPLFGALDDEDGPSGEELAAIEAAMMATNDPLALAAAARGFRYLALEEKRLRSNRVPVLAIVGELDPLVEDARRLESVMPAFRLQVVPGGDHGTTGGRPQFATDVLRFLEGSAVREEEALTPTGER